jgi:ribonuclease R
VRHAMSGERGGTVYRLADRIMVKVARVDLESTKIDFVLAGDDVAPAPKKKTRQGRKP